jgi:hypothetical protein
MFSSTLVRGDEATAPADETPRFQRCRPAVSTARAATQSVPLASTQSLPAPTALLTRAMFFGVAWVVALGTPSGGLPAAG